MGMHAVIMTTSHEHDVEMQERSLELRHELQTKGAVYCLEGYNGNLLAGVNNKLQMYSWASLASGTAHGLSLRHEHCGHILVLYILVHARIYSIKYKV